MLNDLQKKKKKKQRDSQTAKRFTSILNIFNRDRRRFEFTKKDVKMRNEMLRKIQTRNDQTKHLKSLEH